MNDSKRKLTFTEFVLVLTGTFLLMFVIGLLGPAGSFLAFLCMLAFIAFYF